MFIIYQAIHHGSDGHDRGVIANFKYHADASIAAKG
jgi:hypothetical protein